MKLILSFFILLAFNVEGQALVSDSLKLQINSIRVDPHPTFMARDKDSEMFRWHEGSDTIIIDPHKIHYLKMGNCLYVIDSIGHLNEYIWYTLHLHYPFKEK